MINNYSPGNNNQNKIEYFSSWTINSSGSIYKNHLGFEVFDVLTNATATNSELFHYYAANSFRVTNTSLTNSKNNILNRTDSIWSESSTT